MESPVAPAAPAKRWTSLWVVAFLSLLAQLWICQFFSFGEMVPTSIDVNPSNMWKYAYHFPPQGTFQVNNWLGIASLPSPLHPFGLAVNLPAWWFFTTYAPLVSTLALLAMAAFLRELELSRPAALFGAVLYAWQGDILPFVFPGHYGYITTWPFFATAAWGALRAQRTRHWAYALISGASCGLMVELQPDCGSIASLLIAALYLAPILRPPHAWIANVCHLTLCAGVALLISFAAFLALFQSYIVGVKLGGQDNREQTFKVATQFSYGPEDTLTYLVPGALGWHSSSASGPYWGAIGRSLDWPQNPHATRNLNLAISTTGTISAILTLLAACLLLPGYWLGPSHFTDRQRLYGHILLNFGLFAIILSWGYHTPLYRALFELPLMDKWRNPLKWLEWTNFALPVLSAYGTQHLLETLGAETPEIKIMRRRAAWFFGGMLALLTVGLIASFLLELVIGIHLQVQGYAANTIDAILHNLHVSLAVAVMLMALFCLLLRGMWRPEPLRAWEIPNPMLHRLWQKILSPECLPLTLALGFCALGVVQLAWVTSQFIEPNKLRDLTATNPILEQLRSEGTQVRVSAAPEDSYLNALMQNQFYADTISCLDISAASRIPDDLRSFFQALGKNRARMWFLAGVKNVVIPQAFMPQLQHDPAILANIEHADGYVLIPTRDDLPSHALVQMRDYLAKATFVPQAEVISNDKALLKRLADPAWKPRETVLLKSPTPEMPAAATAPASAAFVTVLVYTPQKIEINVQAPQSGYVLINDQYDRDWEAQVNGKPAPLLCADYLLRAVPVPAGSSTLTMDYVSHYRFAGFNLGPAEVINNLCDGFMLSVWIVAGLAVWLRKDSTP